MVRKFEENKLYSLVYNKLCSESIDPIEKKPFFHFLPGSYSYSIASVGCNFSCKHCQNSDISKPDRISGYTVEPQNVLLSAIKKRCRSISYTYTEPTVFFENCYNIGKMARARGLYNNFVTNGYMTPETIKYCSEFLDAANVDLKGDARFYREICGNVELENVMECIKNLFRIGVHLEITTLLIPGENDDRDTLLMLGEFIRSLSVDIPWHLSRFYPAYKMMDKPITPLQTLESAYNVAKEIGINYVYIGNVLGHKYESTYCPNCGEMLIERSGFSVGKIDLEDNRCPNCGEKIPVKLNTL